MTYYDQKPRRNFVSRPDKNTLLQREFDFTDAELANQRWVKVPDIGGLRGTGTWTRLEDSPFTAGEYEELIATQYLPTYRGIRPSDDAPSPAA